MLLALVGVRKAKEGDASHSKYMGQIPEQWEERLILPKIVFALRRELCLTKESQPINVLFASGVGLLAIL